MEIRKLNIEEHGKTRFLYEEVFAEDSQSFVDYYYTEKTKDNQIYVIEEDHGIRAMLHLNPYTLMVNGQEKAANYIVAVATQKEYRGRRFMAKILKRALKDLYQAGELFTFLMPAAEAIYLPYDFRVVYGQKRSYYDCKENLDSQCEVNPLTDAECEELAVAANSILAKRYQVYVKRDKAYYERLKKEYASDQAKLMVYRKNDVIIDCRPWIFDRLDITDELPKIMIRIVDVRKMLMTVQLKSLMAVCFHIVDPVIEENNRCVVLTGTEFSGTMLMDSKPENSEGVITIAALASFLFGAKTVEQICEEDGVRMTERMKGELKKMIPLSKIYLNEIV